MLTVTKGKRKHKINWRPSETIKGTVSVILSALPCKNGNARFTTVPLKPNLIKNVEDNVVFLTRESVDFCEFPMGFLQARNSQFIFAENPQMKMNS